MSDTLDHLDKLIGFQTISCDSNLEIVGYIESFLRSIGASHCVRIPNADGSKSGLLARIGPDAPGGVMLSAHSDVVPVAGQAWTREPFRLSRENGRYFGRGTTDMKGFLASMLSAAKEAARSDLKAPLLLCVSYDEEVGCLGIRHMSPDILREVGRPRACIVGEPTSMQIATGHKGKLAAQVRCTGVAGHSSLAPSCLNAIHLACDVVGALRREQARQEACGARDHAYDIAYATVHAGRISGGIALNIVPDTATVDFEIRHLSQETPDGILANITAECADLEQKARIKFSAARLAISVVNSYPGLDVPADSPAAALVARLLPEVRSIKVAYGTEAGFFSELQIPTVVCGPGSMSQGHQPDEYIEAEQLGQCDAFLHKLVQSLAV